MNIRVLPLQMSWAESHLKNTRFNEQKASANFLLWSPQSFKKRERDRIFFGIVRISSINPTQWPLERNTHDFLTFIELDVELMHRHKKHAEFMNRQW